MKAKDNDVLFRKNTNVHFINFFVVKHDFRHGWNSGLSGYETASVVMKKIVWFGFPGLPPHLAT